MFTEDRTETAFRWVDLGDLQEGRPHLGDLTTVKIYRLMQFTLRDELIRQFDPDTAARIFYAAGRAAGAAFCETLLDKNLGLPDFIAQLQATLKEHRVGVLRVEQADLSAGEVTVSILEDLDCSGLPDSGETVCDYDEGFLSGILESYTGRPFTVREVDCWASGGRACRFEAHAE